jgi:hypothetical protein
VVGLILLIWTLSFAFQQSLSSSLEPIQQCVPQRVHFGF